MEYIGDFTFTEKQIEFICGALNWHGDGKHPIADNKTFKDFKTEYVKDILNRECLLTNLSETGQETINGIKLKLYPTTQLEVAIDSLWDYDRSLCQSQKTIGLKVKAIEGNVVRFYDEMAYEGYGLEYFDGKTFKPHVPKRKR